MDYFQPKNSYKFSTDAILLAEFSFFALERNILSKKRGKKAPFYLLDLGCGCGVVGLEVLKSLKKYSSRSQDFCVLAIDKEEELVRAATINAKNFGLEEQYKAVCLDIEDYSTKDIHILYNMNKKEHIACTNSEQKSTRIFDAIMTNPPWYHEERGIISQNPLRKSALFGKNKMEIFLNFADKYLKDKSSLFMISKPAYFMHCVRTMPSSLHAQYLQNVYTSKKRKNATFFLLEAKRKGKGDCIFTAPKFTTS